MSEQNKLTGAPANGDTPLQADRGDRVGRPGREPNKQKERKIPDHEQGREHETKVNGLIEAGSGSGSKDPGTDHLIVH